MRKIVIEFTVPDEYIDVAADFIIDDFFDEKFPGTELRILDDGEIPKIVEVTCPCCTATFDTEFTR